MNFTFSLLSAVAIFFIHSYTIQTSPAQINETEFKFQFEGVPMHGVLNLPTGSKPKGIVLIVHGSGKTNAVADRWYLEVRKSILKGGFGTCMWDKKGCGKSGGVFEYNQPIRNSAQEVVAAITELKKQEVPGNERIGLWGISRAGWINPIVITEFENISFWISVSGVDEQENFKYLLRQNLRIAGHPKKYVDLIVNQWAEGVKICHQGGSFQQYQTATKNLRRDPFYIRFTGGETNEKGYYSYQKSFVKKKLDKKTGLQIYVPDFKGVLGKIECPVLALFGEKDMNVDWKKTAALYKSNLTSSKGLTIKTYPNCNHNLFECKTGGFYEIQDNQLQWKRNKQFLSTITDWLNELD